MAQQLQINLPARHVSDGLFERLAGGAVSEAVLVINRIMETITL
jgi:hypothetical protein